MPVIHFTIDPTTGHLEMHIQGIVGSACNDVAKLVEDLLGEPSREQKTSEYYVRPQVRPQVKPRGQR